MKLEQVEDDDSLNQGPVGITENENDTHPDYENSMLARSLLSGNCKKIYTFFSLLQLLTL